jgi:teichoic acid transport system ATP-binding protein
MIVDEALSVGDKGFAQKCINKMKELRDEGKTIIFISHNLKQV